MDMTLRMNRAPTPFRKTVSLLASGPLFHESYPGTGTMNGHVADTGQTWGDGSFLAAGSAALMTLTGAGEVTSTPQVGGPPFARAAATIVNFNPDGATWTTVFRIDNDGGPPVNTTLLGNQEIGLNAEDDYVGFSIFLGGTGGTDAYFSPFAFANSAAWPSVLLSDFGVNCALGVEHTVIVQISGLVVTYTYDGVLIFTGSLTALSAAYNYILASTEVATGQGFLPYLLDSLIEIP